MKIIKKKISVIIPIYNEEWNINEIYNRLIKTLDKDFINFSYEIICIDDGSSDDSLKLLKKIHKEDSNLKIIQFSRNFGHHIAITAWLDYADWDYIIMMDWDLQDQPEEIIKLYNKLLKWYDVVYWNRINKQFWFIKRISSKLFNFLISKMIDENIIINSTIFRIMKKEVLININKLREHDRYIIWLIWWVWFSHTKQDIIHGKRIYGQSKYNFYSQLKLALNAIFSFSNYPLRLIIKIWLMFVLISIIYIITIIYNKIYLWEALLWWTSLIASIFLIWWIQIITMWVIWEYIWRSYIENKKRPLYIIKYNTYE